MFEAHFQSRPRFDLNWFWILNYILILVVLNFTVSDWWAVDYRTQLYLGFSYLSHGLLFLCPLFLFYGLLRWVASSGIRQNTLFFLTGLTVVFLFADRIIYTRFGFHFNGFVWNLLTTPGGVESLGGDHVTTQTCAIMALAMVGLEWWLGRASLFLSRYWMLSRRGLQKMFWILLLMGVTERLMYAFSDIKAYTPILSAAQRFPFYVPLTIRHVMAKWGVQVERTGDMGLKSSTAPLIYPSQPLSMVVPARPMNVVWLTVESWRSDLLTPEIMPNTFAAAQKSQRFLNHYSGGNGTRVGVFTQFYGLSGQYWFPFLNERKGPILIDVLQQQNYQIELFTSARFSYPEFDKTVFVKIPDVHLHEGESNDAGWVRDHHNVDQLIDFWESRDRSRPFMNFMFFESPHARYHFPESAVIRRPYLESVNYATLSEADMPMIFNRYVNACHYLDQELSRIFNYFSEHELWKNTIVILTGDHGEEFMEKGHWGHNSEFTEEQLRVPLAVWLPHQAPRVWDKMTSHLDIVPTIMPLLGVQNPPVDYTLGLSLTDEAHHDHILVADWSRLGYLDGQYKASFPLQTTGLFQGFVSDAQDRVLENSQVFFQTRQKNLAEVMQEIRRFHVAQ